MNGIGLEDTVVSLGYREKLGIRCAGIVVGSHALADAGPVLDAAGALVGMVVS